MKTLILKELRENLKVAVIALLMSVAVVAGSQMYYINLIKGIGSAVSSAQNYFYRLQPLTSGNFTGFAIILCALVGVMLGWIQIHAERHRDLWAYLVHRPVTRTTIFLSKVIAGLLIYAVTVGLPLAYFVLWAKTPGHVAAPFEWGMVWPIVGIFLSGVAWYFAGMLTGIRQARWYGSRALGIGAALLATVAAFDVLGAWLGILLTAALVLAVWGAFHNRGQFQGQPVVGKAALTLSIVSGAGLAVLGIVALVLEIVLGLNNVAVWPHYAMGRGGVIYKVTENSAVPQIMSLDGQPLNDPDTGRSMELEKFNRTAGLGGLATVSRGRVMETDPQSQRLHLLVGDRHTLWFNLNLGLTARIEAYDVQTRRFIGSLGPDGFANNKTGDGNGFLPREPWQFSWSGDNLQLIASPKAIYQVDFEHRIVKPLWTAPADDPIEASSGTLNGESTLALTRHNILFFHFPNDGGKPVWSVPYWYSNHDRVTVTAYGFAKAGEASFSVWIGPPFWANPEAGSTQPTHVFWLTRKGEITRSEDLPGLGSRRGPQGALRILNAVMPPLVHLIHPWLGNSPATPQMDWQALRFGFGLAAVYAAAGLWLGRRYSFSAKRQAEWTLFNLFFGFPGLLAFISVQEWPARERCDNCGQLRVVDREKCEHCNTGFPAPKKNGTEIFEVPELCNG